MGLLKDISPELKCFQVDTCPQVSVSILVQVILHPESRRCRLCHLHFPGTNSWFSMETLRAELERTGCGGSPSTHRWPLPGEAPLCAVEWRTRSHLSLVDRYDWVSLAAASGLWLRGRVRKDKHQFLRVKLGIVGGGHTVLTKLKTTGGGFWKWRDQLILGLI